MVNPNSAQLGHCCRGFQGFCQWDGPCTWPANLKISGYPSECNCCARWVSMPKGGFWFTWNDTSFSGELNWQRHPWQFVLLTRESKARSYFLGKRKDLDCWNECAGKWDFSALTKGHCWHEPRSQGFFFLSLILFLFTQYLEYFSGNYDTYSRVKTFIAWLLWRFCLEAFPFYCLLNREF